MSGFSQKSGDVTDSDETSVPEKRRKRSSSEKQRIVEASYKPGASVRTLAEEHGLHPTQLYKWRRLYGRKLEGKSGAALLPVRVTDAAKRSKPISRALHRKPEAVRSVTIHLEFENARVRIENADRATVLIILERLVR